MQKLRNLVYYFALAVPVMMVEYTMIGISLSQTTMSLHPDYNMPNTGIISTMGSEGVCDVLPLRII